LGLIAQRSEHDATSRWDGVDVYVVTAIEVVRSELDDALADGVALDSVMHITHILGHELPRRRWIEDVGAGVRLVRRAHIGRAVRPEHSLAVMVKYTILGPIGLYEGERRVAVGRPQHVALPGRERPAAQLKLALDRCGRQGDALDGSAAAVTPTAQEAKCCRPVL